MRLFGLALVLPVTACFGPNPGFVLTGGDHANTSTGATADASYTDPGSTSAAPTTEAPDTTSGVGASASGESLTATSEPAPTSSGAGTTDSSGSECSFANAGDQTRYVHDGANAYDPVTDCEGSGSIWIGSLNLENGDLRMVPSLTCNPETGDPDLILGKSWPSISSDHFYPCVYALVDWKKVDNACQIGRLLITTYAPEKPPTQDVTILYIASLSLPFPGPDPDFFPKLITPPSKPCGCDDEMPDCCDPEPGQYELYIQDVGPVASTAETNLFGGIYRFKNIQSYIDPGCPQDPADVHIDWFVEKLL